MFVIIRTINLATKISSCLLLDAIIIITCIIIIVYVVIILIIPCHIVYMYPRSCLFSSKIYIASYWSLFFRVVFWLF